MSFQSSPSDVFIWPNGKGKPVIYAGERTTARCPKCKKQNFITEEIFEEIVYMTIKNGVFPDEADDHQPGEILGVSCTCNECGHHWTPRGARTLGDIVDESSNGQPVGGEGI